MFGPQRGSWVGNQREIRQVSPREGLGVVIPIRPGHTPEVLKLLGDGAERGRFYTYFFPAGELIELSPTEFELLRFLMRNPRRVLSKAQILDRVWSYDFGGRAHVVELYISYLRKKVDAGREPMIHTMRGAGYVLKPVEA